MTAPVHLARPETDRDGGARAHLERLMGSWGLLADLSFSDLLLYAPAGGADAGGSMPDELLVIGQIRPTTSPTFVEQDLVGHAAPAAEVPDVAAAWRAGAVTRASGAPGGPGPTELECVPVRWRGEVVGIIRRIWSPSGGRRRGNLELTYLELFERFAGMVAAGIFPFVSDDAAIGEAPRVGDGVVIVDAEARITYASPNGVSALHRMGVVSATTGSTLGELGVQVAAVEQALASRLPAIEELERPGDVIVLFRSIPLVAAGQVTGALVLVRDVTDLRRRDRLLLSKDAAIREVHHRVKNNLQTISSLLRVQSRRLDSPAGREALAEAERRIRSIALVHELLSRESGDQVPFGEIVHSLVRVAKDSHVSATPLSLRVDGDAGRVATDIATPLALVLAELLQNAVRHAFALRPTDAVLPQGTAWWEGAGAGAAPAGGAPTGEGVQARGARVEVVFRLGAEVLRVEVRDNGQGFPEGFDLERHAGLGLAIVRDLVRSQLGGTISQVNEGGAIVRLAIPMQQALRGRS